MAIGASQTAGFVTAKDERGIKLGQHNVQTLEVLKEGTQMMDESTDATQIEDSTPATSTPLEPKPKARHRRKSLSVDPDLLRAAAYSLGIQLRGRGGSGGLTYEAALAYLLEHLAQERSPSVPPTTPKPPEDQGAIATIKHQARTLAWLTGRIETLEQLVEQLQHERHEAISQTQKTGESAQLQQLQQENQTLREERDQATSKLQAFRHLLLGTAITQDQQPPEKKTAQPLEPTTSTNHPPADIPEPPKPFRKRTSEADALQHIRNAVQAIIAFNDQPGCSFDHKWYISFPVVQTLLRAHGLSANQKIVAIVFEELKHQLEEHHEQHHLGSRHNRRHPDVGKIAEVVNLNQ